MPVLGSTGANSLDAPAPAPSRRRLLLLLLGVLAIVVAGIGLALATGSGLTSGEAVRFGLVMAWAVGGMVVVARQPDEGVGAIIVIGAFVGSFGGLGRGLIDAGARGDLEGFLPELGGYIRPVAVCLLPAFFFHLIIGLPNGYLGPGPRRWMARTMYAIAALVGVIAWVDRPNLQLWPVWTIFLTGLVIGIPTTHRRYRHARGYDRHRLQWVGWAVALAVEVTLVVIALDLLLKWPRHEADVGGALTALIPFSLALASSQGIAARIDRLLARTISLVGLSALVVAVYVVVVLGLGRAPTDQERGLLALSMAAAVVAAVLYLPARARLGLFANRLVYGEREAPDEVLSTFGTRLSRAIPLDELLLQMAESLRKTLGLSAAEVWTGSGGLLERAASVPDRGGGQLTLSEAEAPVVARAGVSGPAWLAVWLPSMLERRPDALLRVAPITHSGELLGLIVAERPADGEQFNDEEERVLAELARQVGLALHNVQLDSALQASLDEVRRQAEELRASRARIVAVGDAERRRIERNLHDGAQQHLVALAVKLRLAQDLTAEDPAEAKALLEELADDVKATLQELRDLAHGIYPPLLMSSGLREALHAAAGRATLPTDIDAPDIGRYPADVEAAVYFTCLEAVQNAGKHAGEEAAIVIRLWEEAGTLRFEVTDDGVGFDPAAVTAGAGFVNMSDRIGAIGGTVHFDSTPGQGTTVSGVVPLQVV